MELAEEVFDFVVDFGRLVDEIKFKEIPPRQVFEALVEQNNNIRLNLLGAGSLDIAVDRTYGGNIISVDFETDYFTDSACLYSYPNLEHLYLECHNSSDSFDVRDISDMQLALVNLTKLKSLTLDIRYMNPDAVEQIEKYMIFPGRDFNVSVKKKKIRR